MQYVHFYYTPGLGGWCWGASHQRSAAVGARGAADQALAEAVGVEHVSARRDPRHVHRLQAHRTRGPRLLQLLLTRTRDTQPRHCSGHLGGLSEGLKALDLLLQGAEHLGAEPGEGHVEVGVGGEADQQRQPGRGQHAEQQAGQGEVTRAQGGYTVQDTPGEDAHQPHEQGNVKVLQLLEYVRLEE